MGVTLQVESKIPNQQGLHTLRDLSLSKVSAGDVIRKLAASHKVPSEQLCLQIENKVLTLDNKKCAEPLNRVIGSKPPRVYLQLIENMDDSKSSAFRIPIVAVHKTSSGIPVANELKTPPTPPYTKTGALNPSSESKQKLMKGGKNFKQPPNPTRQRKMVQSGNFPDKQRETKIETSITTVDAKIKKDNKIDGSVPAEGKKTNQDLNSTDKRSQKRSATPDSSKKSGNAELGSKKKAGAEGSASQSLKTDIGSKEMEASNYDSSVPLVKMPVKPSVRKARSNEKSTFVEETSKGRPVVGTVRNVSSRRSMSPVHRVTVDLLVDERGIGCFGIKVPINRPKTKLPPASPPPASLNAPEDHLKHSAENSRGLSVPSEGRKSSISPLSTPARQLSNSPRDSKITMDQVIIAGAPKKDAWVPSGQAPWNEINNVTKRRIAARKFPSPKVKRSRSLTKGTQTGWLKHPEDPAAIPTPTPGFIPSTAYNGLRDGYYFGYECNQLGYIPLSNPEFVPRNLFSEPIIRNAPIDACYEEADELFPVP